MHRLIKKFQIEKDLTASRKGNYGRKKKITSRMDAYLLRKSKFNPRKTSFQLQQDLASAGVMVDSSTVLIPLPQQPTPSCWPESKTTNKKTALDHPNEKETFHLGQKI